MDEVLGSWVDGVAGTSIPIDDRGLQYGDGIFETILVRKGIPRFLELHRERLRRGLARLGIPFTAEEGLNADIARAAALAPRLAILKIIITRGSSQRRGYGPAGNPVARRVVSLWPTTPLAREVVEQGASLRVAVMRMAESSPLAGVKHLNRLENVLAATELMNSPATLDCLMLDVGERIVSGTSSNVFLVKSGELLTPPVNRVGIAGVMRAVVLREAPRLGITAREQELTLRDLRDAEGMFITNVRIGVVPVEGVREHLFGMTEIARKLRDHIEALDA